MKNSIFFLITLVLFMTHAIMAQDRLSIELRIGPSFTTQDLGNSELNTGIGIEGIVDYRISDLVGAYVGWGWNHFSADESFAGNKSDFEETGYLFGLQLNQSLGDGPLALYARLGGIYNHIEVENNDGDIIADSGHGLGWRAGIGMDIHLGSNWHLKPGIKYQSLARDLEVESQTTDVKLNYLAPSIGISKRF